MKALHSRQVREGGYSFAYILVFLAILGALNWLADQYNKTYDATEQKLYSLSDQTLKVLDGLEGELTIYHFDQRSRFDLAKQNLVRYENASRKVSVRYIDPDSSPEKAKAMNVRTYGTTFVEIAGTREEADSTDEESITNAVIKLLKGEENTACFLTGHGEAEAGDSERDGFQTAADEIEAANFKTKTISLLENPEVPADCTALIVAGPQTGYLEPEVDILGEYVEGGGRLLLMIDYDQSPELVELAARWGVDIKDDLVIDVSGIGRLFGGSPLTPLVADYSSHPITEVMSNVAAFFPMVRSVVKGDSADNWTVTELLSTTSASFATADFRIESDELVRNADKETEGPINIAVAGVYEVPEPSSAADEDASEPDSSEDQEADEADLEEEESKPEGRIVIIGTSMFARNNFVSRGGNLDLLLNMVSWLSSDEDLISIRPKDPERTPLDLSESQMQRVFLGTVFLLPAVILIAGVRTWWMRR